jgi:dihydrofolate synthase / folylpolyglutamate synthase
MRQPLSALLNHVTDWLDYISRLHHQEMDFGLDRILAVVQPLKWHRFTCPVVIVGGTNGKGSCVRFLESIFSAAGYRVGAYTSPHLMAFNERIRVNNREIDDASLIDAFTAVEKHRGSISLSFFEYTFLAALQIFQQAQLDLVILEVGLGGRLDAVNIVDADIAVITTIDLDHTELLGQDRESIAREKAGIFRPGKIVVCGDPQPPENLRQAAAQLDARWFALGENFHFRLPDSSSGQWQWWIGAAIPGQRELNSYSTHLFAYQDLPAIILKHQNAATSLMVVKLLQDRLPVADKPCYQGLAQAALPGRFEKFFSPQQVKCYLDVAHNPQGGRWLAEQWRQTPVPGKKIAILGMLGDKDIAGTVQSLLHYVDSWYLASLSVSRGATAERLNGVLAALGIANCHLYQTVEDALQAAMQTANLEQDAILVFGSFYTVAAARQYLLLRRGL